MTISKVLILGYSDIVRRRVLPALAALGGLRVAVASRTRLDQLSGVHGPPVTGYGDYESALRLAAPDLVYVSTVNSGHGEWAARALERGCHVIVDKPAFGSHAEAACLVECARRQGLCLAEATVFAFHPQIRMLADLFAREQCSPSCLTVQFSFPPLPPTSYRYARALGGGAIRDLGIYAVATGRLFAGTPLREVFCRVTSQKSDVEESFTAALIYEGGCSLVGQLGFRTGYINRLDLLGPGLTVMAERVFTTPPDLENTLHVRRQGVATEVVCPAADAFLMFFSRVFQAIAMGTHGSFADILLADAHGMDLVRAAAGV